MTLETIVFWLSGIAVLVIAIAGVRDRIVIYYDKKDFWISFLPWGVWFIGAMWAANTQPQVPIDYNTLTGEQTMIFQIAYAVMAVLAIEVVRRSIKYNRSFPLGCIVAVFKLAFAGFAVFGSLGQMSKVVSSSSSMFMRGKGLILFFIIQSLWDEFINGKDVYARKGWTLEE